MISVVKLCRSLHSSLRGTDLRGCAAPSIGRATPLTDVQDGTVRFAHDPLSSAWGTCTTQCSAFGVGIGSGSGSRFDRPAECITCKTLGTGG